MHLGIFFAAFSDVCSVLFLPMDLFRAFRHVLPVSAVFAGLLDEYFAATSFGCVCASDAAQGSPFSGVLGFVFFICDCFGDVVVALS